MIQRGSGKDAHSPAPQVSNDLVPATSGEISRAQEHRIERQPAEGGDRAHQGLAPTRVIQGKLIDQQDRPVAKARLNGLRGNRRYGFGRTNDKGEFSIQVPKALEMERYQVWLEDDDSPHPPIIEQADPLILRLVVPPNNE